MTFSKEIQGMRAIAVLAVVLVHLGCNWLPGGFVGVDVFFVISGYLITGLLLAEQEKMGHINLANFYRRRIRRLFPALFVTVMASVLAGFFLFSNERFGLLIDSALSAIFSVSNIYFWSQVGYFDTEAAVKPLLHTWSLGVEEQFYLVWPLLILLLSRFFSKNIVLLMLFLLGVGSFWLNDWFIVKGGGDGFSGKEWWSSNFKDGASSAFYLMPFRIFEFALGALLVFSPRNRLSVTPFVADAFVLFSLAGLFYLMATLTEKSVFPYYNALWVALLSATLIAFSASSNVATFLLANPLMVFVGGISYSLYLVHWPLIVYHKSVFGEIDVESMLGLLSCMFVSAAVLHFTVENRFRVKSVENYRFSVFLAPIGIFFAVVFLVVLRDVDWRIPESRVAKTNSELRAIERKKYCNKKITGFPDAIFTCQQDRGSDHTVVVWGDSHALHLVAGISELFPRSNIAVAYLTGCVSQSGFDGFVRKFPSHKMTVDCEKRNKAFLRWAENQKNELLIFVSNAKRSNPDKMAAINNMHIEHLNRSGHAAYVVGDFIRPGVELAQCFSVPDYIINDEMLLKRCRTDANAVESELRYSKRLAAQSVKYIAVHTLQCPMDNCRFVDGNGRVTFRDSHHLSSSGAIYWLSELVKSRDPFMTQAISIASSAGLATQTYQ